VDTTKEYKVFISYSWTTPEHEEWVCDLATRLMENGVEVKFDKWDLKPGQDKYVFMESMVKDKSINRILVICDKGYKEKADNRQGGVGTETQIITPEIYSDVEQEKFIPIIAEKGEQFDSYLPNFIKTRIGIDLSCEDVFEKEYEKLLRLITERPLYRKPIKGQLPSYLFDDEISHFKTKNTNKVLKNALTNRPERANFVILDFIEELKESLYEYQVNHDELKEPYDETVVNLINNLLPLRNDYIEFISNLCKSGINFEIDIIINLFEDIFKFTEFEGSGTYYDSQFDHYRFFIKEMFLYTVIVLIENRLFEKLDILLSTKYFVKTKRNHEKGVDFTRFCFDIKSLDYDRNKRLKLNRLSVQADMLIQRGIVQGKDYKSKLVDAELLLHFLSVIKSSGDMYLWFPATYVYLGHRTMEILKRLVSERHFEKVRVLFGIKDKEEMKTLIRNYKAPYRGYSHCFEDIPSLSEFINPNDICSCK